MTTPESGPVTQLQHRESGPVTQLQHRETHGRLPRTTHKPRTGWQRYWTKLPPRCILSLPTLLRTGSARELLHSCLMGFSKDLYHLISYRSRANSKRYYLELWQWSTAAWHSFRREVEIPIGPPELEQYTDEWLFANQDHPYMQVMESDDSNLFAVSTEPFHASTDSDTSTRYLTLFPNPVRYSPTHALHLSYDCISEVHFKPHLQLISVQSEQSTQYHLILNNGTALYHIVLELVTAASTTSAPDTRSPFEFAASEPLTASQTLLHDTRDYWQPLAEDEVKQCSEPLGPGTRPSAQLTVRRVLKFDAEQYLSALLKRVSALQHEVTEDWHLALALLTREVVYATLSVRTRTRLHCFMLRLSHCKSTALWHLATVPASTQRLAHWIARTVLPFVHSRAHTELVPAYAILPMHHSWQHPLVISNLPVLHGKSLSYLPHCYFPLAIAK